MKKVLLIALALLITNTSFADMFDDLKITKIENADLVCSGNAKLPKMVIAINSKDARVWQTKPGEKNGLELTITAFRRARCPNCYSFDGFISAAGEKTEIKGQTNMDFTKNEVTLDYTFGDKEIALSCETHYGK